VIVTAGVGTGWEGPHATLVDAMSAPKTTTRA
jgi:hypothetical protein